MKTSGIALPELHVQVVYFGSRRCERNIHRLSRPSPCWVLHWNQTGTATIRFAGRLSRLGPDVISLAAPRTVAEETMRLGEEHTYLHFLLGPRYDRVESRVLVLPTRGAVRGLLKTLSDSYRNKDRLDHRDEFGVHALISLVLREVPPTLWIEPFLTERPLHAYLFLPLEAEAKRYKRLHVQSTHPKTLGIGDPLRALKASSRFLGDHYDTTSYARAIARGCEVAFPPPDRLARLRFEMKGGFRWEEKEDWQKRLGKDGWAELQAWQKEHHWHPHQLRHNFAADVRWVHGLEIAQVLLGHAKADVTQIYAERDLARAIEVARKIG